MAGTPCPAEFIHDFGGDGPLMHLAHANGFPPGTYRLLAERLTERYHVIGLPARPLWSGSPPAPIRSQDLPRTWQPLADDLVAGLEQMGQRGIVGVGHSLGGVLTLLAAIGRPELFRAVVLIDPVVLPPARLRALRGLRLLHLERRLPLVQAALRRRRTWPSREACYGHLAAKPFFAAWPAESLRAYVEAGTCPRPDGQVELAYPPEWEAHIFATTPADVWRAVPRLRTPSLWIRGERSPTFCAECLERVARLLPQACTLTITDSDHMVPVERPSETAAAIAEFLL